MSRLSYGHCDWHLGYPVRGLQSAEEGLAAARENSHPFSIALALNYLAMLHQFRREADAALRAAAEARNICAEYRFDYYGAWSGVVRAWAIAESGGLDEGLAAYEAALEEFRRTNAALRISHHLGLRAVLHGNAGRALDGLRLIDKAIAIAKENNESWCNAELHRERGQLLLLASGHDAETQADKEFQGSWCKSGGLCHVAVPRARIVGASGIVRPLRLRSATWSSRHRSPPRLANRPDEAHDQGHGHRQKRNDEFTHGRDRDSARPFAQWE